MEPECPGSTIPEERVDMGCWSVGYCTGSHPVLGWYVAQAVHRGAEVVPRFAH